MSARGPPIADNAKTSLLLAHCVLGGPRADTAATRARLTGGQSPEYSGVAVVVRVAARDSHTPQGPRRLAPGLATRTRSSERSPRTAKSRLLSVHLCRTYVDFISTLYLLHRTRAPTRTRRPARDALVTVRGDKASIGFVASSYWRSCAARQQTRLGAASTRPGLPPCQCSPGEGRCFVGACEYLPCVG